MSKDNPSKAEVVYKAVKDGIGWLVNEVATWASMLAKLGLVVLIGSTVAARAGYPIRMLPTMDHMALAAIAVAYWAVLR